MVLRKVQRVRCWLTSYRTYLARLPSRSLLTNEKSSHRPYREQILARRSAEERRRVLVSQLHAVCDVAKGFQFASGCRICGRNPHMWGGYRLSHCQVWVTVTFLKREVNFTVIDRCWIVDLYTFLWTLSSTEANSFRPARLYCDFGRLLTFICCPSPNSDRRPRVGYRHSVSSVSNSIWINEGETFSGRLPHTKLEQLWYGEKQALQVNVTSCILSGDRFHMR